MTEIPDQPFDKIAMDLVTDFTESNKGNKHILTIIDLLMRWLEAIPIPNKSANTITKEFIRHYLPRHLHPQFILLDNSTEFKNQIFDSHKGSWYRKDILCTIPPSKQWETGNIPQIS